MWQLQYNTRAGGVQAVKDHIRDYATAAFRFWAQEGGTANVSGLDRFKRRIICEVEANTAKCLDTIRSFEMASPVEDWLIAQEKAYKQYSAEIADLQAVEEVLRISQYHHDGKMMWQALEIVYFADAMAPMKKGDVEMRVHRAELMIPASRRTIYRLLRKAREIFAEDRGLRKS